MRRMISRPVATLAAALLASAAFALPAAAEPAAGQAGKAAAQPQAGWSLYWVYSTQQQCEQAGKWLVGNGRVQAYQCAFQGTWAWQLWVYS
jgi:hypothetical protein